MIYPLFIVEKKSSRIGDIITENVFFAKKITGIETGTFAHTVIICSDY